MDISTNDPNMKLVANVGADWWRAATAAYVHGSPTIQAPVCAIGSSSRRECRTLGFYCVSTTQFQADLPPPLLGSAQTPPPLSVSVNSAPLAPVTSPPATGANQLVNGSFEASPLAGSRWGSFSSIPGWTALTGGTIELWKNLTDVQATYGGDYGELDYLGARDGLYQTVKTVAGQSYELSFDARSRLVSPARPPRPRFCGTFLWWSSSRPVANGKPTIFPLPASVARTASPYARPLARALTG
jgi:hypothetical protein